MRGFSTRFVCLGISVTDSHQTSDFCECFPTAYLQRRYRSGVQNFSDVPGKPTSQRRGFSGGLSAIPLRSGLQVCLPPRLLPPLRPSLATGQPWRVRSSRTHVVTFMCIEYAHRPNRAIDGRGLSPHKTRGLVGRSWTRTPPRLCGAHARYFPQNFGLTLRARSSAR
jgi:hypothetical protein